MRFRFVSAAAALALAMVTSVHAEKLVVMSVVNTSAGYNTYTIGVQVTAADVAAGGLAPTLGAFGIDFIGDGSNPYTGGFVDLQGIQSASDTLQKAASATAPFSVQNANFSTADAKFEGSWWYNSNGGLLQGALVGPTGKGKTYTTGTVTGSATAPAGGPVNPNSGVAAALGYLWGVQGGTITGGVDGGNMHFDGLFGPNGANALDAAPLAGLFSGGVLTVPLAQITTSGDVQIGYTPGSTFLNAGQHAENVLGGPANVNPGAYLSFSQNQIVGAVPEPGTFALLGMGAVGLLLAWKRRK